MRKLSCRSTVRQLMPRLERAQRIPTDMKRMALALLIALSGCDTVNRYFNDPVTRDEPATPAVIPTAQVPATNALPKRPGERWYPSAGDTNAPKVTIIPMMATPAPNPAPLPPAPKDWTPLNW